jgi:glycosyltransferase involved in cell wall biosynthesis
VQAASLIPVKNQALLIDGLAAAQARCPDLPVHLTLVGQGPLESALRQRAAERGGSAHVTFAGQVRHDALPALYARHDGFILTSRHEAQCLAVLEAAACGLPWIGPPVGALADLAAEQPASGWLVPTPQAKPLATAILAAADPAVRATRGAAARAAVAESYALETQTTRLLALYGALAGTAPATRRWVPS